MNERLCNHPTCLDKTVMSEDNSVYCKFHWENYKNKNIDVDNCPVWICPTCNKEYNPLGWHREVCEAET